MDPTVVAAWIAAGVSALTLVGTLAAQYAGRRATARDADKAFAEQREQLERTLGEQRTRTFNERFGSAAEQLGSDKPVVRLAGVHAMAGLADDWEENRQACVDVLCAYLRLPYDPSPGDGATMQSVTTTGLQDALAEQAAYQANREVRYTIIRLIGAHLRPGTAASWQGLNFDFTGVVFDGGDLHGARFSGGIVLFLTARFRGGTVDFDGARFCGGTVIFDGAEFSGGQVLFNNARFSGSEVSFRGVRFSSGWVRFRAAEFSGGQVHFGGARFSGAEVSFDGAVFSGGQVDFSNAGDWSHSPAFPWTDTPPLGVKLPAVDRKAN